jgi:putative two-component system response regulator
MSGALNPLAEEMKVATERGRHPGRVLAVDDDPRNVRLIEAMLKNDGYEVIAVTDGGQTLSEARRLHPDIILLDVMMPDVSGFDVTRLLKADAATKTIPVIMVTALDDRESRLRGLDAGAEEFLTKPVDRAELISRVRNLMRLKEFNDFLARHGQLLEKMVAERTAQLKGSYRDTVFTMMRAAEYRDDETGAHVQRISYYCRELAERMGMDDDYCELIFYASPMHDVGKIGIPDHILLKSGSFTPEEWALMQTHTTIGANILSKGDSPYLRMGVEIARSHHEHWDGSGYPDKLVREQIPLAARVMQIADVYDALRSKRPYKPAFDHQKAMDIITKGDEWTRPGHFDPAVLGAFVKAADTFAEIFKRQTE